MSPQPLQQHIVRRAWLDYAADGLEGMLAHCSHDVAWTSFLANGRTARGHDGVRAMFDGMAAHGISQVSVPYRYSTQNDRVIVSVDIRSTTGGIASFASAYLLYRFEGDKIAALQEFITPQEAMAAAAQS